MVGSSHYNRLDPRFTHPHANANPPGRSACGASAW